MKKFLIQSKDELTKVAHEIVPLLPKIGVVCFQGEMGVGKTTLINSICEIIGVTDQVTSPTFSIVNEYNRNLDAPVYHFDLYRLNNLDELMDIGFEDYLAQDALIFVEWPDIALHFLPSNTALIRMSLNENNQRIVEIE